MKNTRLTDEQIAFALAAPGSSNAFISSTGPYPPTCPYPGLPMIANAPTFAEARMVDAA